MLCTAMRALLVVMLAGLATAASAQPAIQHFDFSKDDSFQATVLRGTWGFVWDDHLRPQDAHTAFTQGDLRAIPVPNRWHDLLPADPQNPYLHGIASFVVHITLPELDLDVPLLHLDVVTEAYRVYWIPLDKPDQALLVAQEGTLEGPIVAAQRNLSHPINAQGEGLLLIHVRKNIFSWGEVDRIPVISSLRQDVAARHIQSLMEGFWSGALCFAMLFNLMLYFLRRQDPSALFLASALAFVAIRFLATSNLIETTFGAEWHVMRMRLELGGLLAIAPMALATNQYLLPPFIDTRLFKAVMLSTIAGGLFVAFAPPAPLTAALPIYQIHLLVVAAIGVFGLVRAVQKKRSGAKLLLFAVLVVVAAALHDIASVIIPAYERNVIAAALMVFVFVYTLVVGRRVTYALSRTRVLERDKKQLQRLHSEAVMSARHDHLTGLLNRKAFDLDFSEACRSGQTPVSLMLFDIDHFKSINDTQGHPFGDHVLQGLGQLLMRSGGRSSDRFYRYGGEEFALILEGASVDRAVQIAEHLRHTIATAQLGGPAGQLVRITCSFGVATTIAPKEESTALLAAADRALYDAKRAGRDRVETAFLAPSDATTAA